VSEKQSVKEDSMAIVKYEKQEHLVIITMNRPERRNAMSQDLMLGLAES
jgi:enoyl-CoA hydratase/carnithine racemase